MSNSKPTYKQYTGKEMQDLGFIPMNFRDGYAIGGNNNNQRRNE